MEWIKSLIDFISWQQEEAVGKIGEGAVTVKHVSDMNYLQISNTLFNFYYDIEI